MSDVRPLFGPLWQLLQQHVNDFYYLQNLLGHKTDKIMIPVVTYLLFLHIQTLDTISLSFGMPPYKKKGKI